MAAYNVGRVAGSRWYKGNGTSNATIKAEVPNALAGDMYLSNFPPNQVWNFDGTNWSSSLSIKGNKGDNGIMGPPGSPGPEGPQGNPGPIPSNVEKYDYVVNSNASLEALDLKQDIGSVLIKKGTWTSTIPVRISISVARITGEAGSLLVFPDTSTSDGLICWMKSLSAIGNLIVSGVYVKAGRYAFSSFPFVQNCQGEVYSDSSSGPAPFYDCDKVLDCICTARAGGKIFSTKQCLNVRGCRRVVTGSNTPAPYETSYSGSIASATYACADTLNGGWNK